MAIDYKELGQRIKKSRKFRRMTQAKLVATIELSDVFISNIETGTKHPSMETLNKIAVALDVDIEILLCGNRIIELPAHHVELFTLISDFSLEQIQAITAVVAILKQGI